MVPSAGLAAGVLSFSCSRAIAELYLRLYLVLQAADKANGVASNKSERELHGMRFWKAAGLAGLAPLDVSAGQEGESCWLCERLLAVGTDSVSEPLLFPVLIAFVALVFIARRQDGRNSEPRPAKGRVESRESMHVEPDVPVRPPGTGPDLR